MPELAQTLITLGGLLLIGFLADGLGRRTKLPRVTLLIAFGFLVGPHALALLPKLGHNWFDTVAHLALIMVGFLLGGRLTVSELADTVLPVLIISTVLFELLGPIGTRFALDGAGEIKAR